MQHIRVEVSLSTRSESFSTKEGRSRMTTMDLIEGLMENIPRNDQESLPPCPTYTNDSEDSSTRMKCRKRRSNNAILEFNTSPIKKSRPSLSQSLEPLQCLESVEDLESPSSLNSSSSHFGSTGNDSVVAQRNSKPESSKCSTSPCMFESPQLDLLATTLNFYSGEDEIDYSGGFTPYEEDAFVFRCGLELKFHPILCLRNQPQVTPNMRSVLVDWIAKLNHHFKFCQETLFLTVNVLDRFLLTTPISRDCFQLLGITAFLIAAKQEEVTPPDMEELIRLCCHAFSTFQLKQLELIVLNRLHFDLLVPTSQYFFEHFCATRMRKADMSGSNKEYVKLTRSLGRYILEQCLHNYSICQHQPSLLACSVLELAHTYLHFVRPYESRHTQIYPRRTVDKCILNVKQYTVDLMSDEEMPYICEKYMTLSQKHKY